MALAQKPIDSLSDAYTVLEDLSDAATQEFLLAYETQTTESILGGDGHTVYRFEEFSGLDNEALDLMRERSLEVLDNQVTAVV